MRRPWWFWILGILLLVTTTACAVILPPVYRHRQGAAAEIGMKSTAAGCGGRMYLDPEVLAVRSGTTVAFTNQMDGMAIRYRLFRKGSAELLGESPWLQPGESWSYEFWLPGAYTLSNNFVDFGFVRGLQAAISVGFF